MDIRERHFFIISGSDANKVDYQWDVIETSIDTLRYSTDGIKTFVKSNYTSVSSSLHTIEPKDGPYTYEAMLEILSTEEWTPSNLTTGSL
jgi:hypothetical protein